MGTFTAGFKQTGPWGGVVGTWASLTKTLRPQRHVFHTLPSLEPKPVEKMSFQTTASFLKELSLSKTWWASGYKEVGLVGQEELEKRALGGPELFIAVERNLASQSQSRRREGGGGMGRKEQME